MRMGKRLFILVLAGCLLLGGCASDKPTPTTNATEANQVTQPTETKPAPTEPPAETEPVQTALVPEAVLPAADVATGMLKFYIDDKAVYAGGPVSELLNAKVQTYADTEAVIQPWHISGNTRFRVELEDVAEGKRPYLFVSVINASDEPRPFSECLIYALGVNCNEGIAFGSGNEKEPFVTMQTTRKEILEAYGEPSYRHSEKNAYEEFAYYEPFNCAYFSFKRGVVRQVLTYYCANIYEELAKNQELELDGYFGNDAYLLMTQYMDVKSYLEGEITASCAPDLDTFILMEEEKVEFGCKVGEMPELFSAPFEDLTQYISNRYYIRTGKGNEEEFFLMNNGGMRGAAVKNATVKGVITQNRNYTNWGFDYQAFHEFEYQGLKSDSTIEDVLRIFGLPQEMYATSSAKACYVWMHYKDQYGNTLHICVDPMVNQVIELKAAKFFMGERHY